MDLYQLGLPLYLLLLLAGSSVALYGFDCTDQLSNVTTISLVDFGECDMQKPETTVETKRSQLVQLNEFGLTHVYKCLTKITRIITHCGMHSHASRVEDGEISYYKEFLTDECLQLQKTGSITIAGTLITNIPRNGTVQRAVIFAGSSNNVGECEGAPYSDPYGKWKKVYVAGWVEITMADFYREVHIDTNKIMLPSGVNCKFSDLFCTDLDAGYVLWNALPEDVCGISRYSVLYEGPISKIHEKNKNKVMFMLEAQDITFALWKKEDYRICGYKLARTEHPKLFIVEDIEANGFMKSVAPATANLDIFAYM